MKGWGGGVRLDIFLNIECINIEEGMGNRTLPISSLSFV